MRPWVRAGAMRCRASTGLTQPAGTGTILRQNLPGRNRSGRLRQPHVGEAVASLVSTADGRAALGSGRRLIHRRASLACQAPIARRLTSATGRQGLRGQVVFVVITYAASAVHIRPEPGRPAATCKDRGLKSSCEGTGRERHVEGEHDPLAGLVVRSAEDARKS